MQKEKLKLSLLEFHEKIKVIVKSDNFLCF